MEKGKVNCHGVGGEEGIRDGIKTNSIFFFGLGWFDSSSPMGLFTYKLWIQKLEKLEQKKKKDHERRVCDFYLESFFLRSLPLLLSSPPPTLLLHPPDKCDNGLNPSPFSGNTYK